MRVAVLGLGEAGRHYAADLVAAGWVVTGYDPGAAATPDGVRRAGAAAEAVAGADLVLSLTGARAAVPAAAEAAAGLPAGACYADLNTGSARLKEQVAEAVRPSGAAVADVAVLAPVPRAGARTPLLASGPGAARVAELLGVLGAAVEVLAEPVGVAAARKLLRAEFMKGLAAVVLETVAAGAAAGCPDWVRGQIAGELGPGGAALVDRLITGSALHAVRRVDEMEAVRGQLAELGVRADVCEATLTWLRALAAGEPPPG
jgi:3-hydroxyisobutyrate dehydrogenase-like beta-hydroxyacid dehydrogenase